MQGKGSRMRCVIAVKEHSRVNAFSTLKRGKFLTYRHRPINRTCLRIRGSNLRAYVRTYGNSRFYYPEHILAQSTQPFHAKEDQLAGSLSVMPVSSFPWLPSFTQLKFTNIGLQIFLFLFVAYAIIKQLIRPLKQKYKLCRLFPFRLVDAGYS